MVTFYKIETIEQTESTVHFHILKNDIYLSFQDVFDLWEENEASIKFYVSEIKKFNFETFYWEHPALKEEFLTKKYECIVQKSKSLRLKYRSQNEEAFANFIWVNFVLMRLVSIYLGK